MNQKGNGNTEGIVIIKVVSKYNNPFSLFIFGNLAESSRQYLCVNVIFLSNKQQ